MNTRVCAVSVPNAWKLVGVIGFEPTTPSSRTKLPYPKILRYIEVNVGIDGERKGNMGVYLCKAQKWRERWTTGRF
jgi:hypothetical protein